MQAWDFLVDRSDLSRTLLAPASETVWADLADGDVLLEVERFSLTANNITYGVFGDRLGYWRFFPTADGWGRIPVWGFARVAASRAAGVEEGTRLYGYLPMSTHLVTRLRPSGGGFVDETAHRAALPAAYNRYEPMAETPRDDHVALLRPLFTTSFLLDDLLADAAHGATAILSSASSRTAIGLAWLRSERGLPTVALTSARNAAFVESLGLYAQVVDYADIERADVDGPVAFVDMAGDPAVRGAVHRRFADRLVHSAVVGATHHDAAPADPAPLPGPVPTFFFAPDRLARRREDWGGAVVAERIGAAMTGFIADASWLTIDRSVGPDALASTYSHVLEGDASPAVGDVVFPGVLPRG